MCILFFMVNRNPEPGGYKLIVASNRDEFYCRPALAAAPWEEHQFVIGGRDLQVGRQGGTWLAISSKGGVIKFGALLNIAGQPRKRMICGRGYLVSNYVSGNDTIEDYCKQVMNTEGSHYKWYNLVLVELKENNATTVHCSNMPKMVQKWPDGKPQAFGNSPPSTPLYKVKCGKKIFEEILENSFEKNDLVNNLMDMLQCKDKFWPDDELYERVPNWGEELSSIFVKMPENGYGTRTHAVILIDWQNRMDFYEETMTTADPDGPWKKNHIRRQL